MRQPTKNFGKKIVKGIKRVKRLVIQLPEEQRTIGHRTYRSSSFFLATSLESRLALAVMAESGVEKEERFLPIELVKSVGPIQEVTRMGFRNLCYAVVKSNLPSTTASAPSRLSEAPRKQRPKCARLRLRP